MKMISTLPYASGQQRGRTGTLGAPAGQTTAASGKENSCVYCCDPRTAFDIWAELVSERFRMEKREFFKRKKWMSWAHASLEAIVDI